MFLEKTGLDVAFRKKEKGVDFAGRTEYITAFVVLLLVTLFFCFEKDFYLTLKHSIWFDTCLFNGKLHRFYSIVNTEALKGGFGDEWVGLTGGANYSIINYATFGLVCLPIYIIERVLNVAVSLLAYQMMIKVFYVFLTLYLNKILVDIAELVGIEKNRASYAGLLLLTSPLFLFSSIMITHLDILPLFFTMLGIRSMLKGNTRNMLIFFAVGLAYKPFALIMIIPIMLLREKRLLFLFRDLAVSVSLLVLQGLVYRIDPGYIRIQNYMSEHYNFLERFLFVGFDSTRNVYIVNSSYFVIAFALVCMLAYYVKTVKNIYYFAFPLVACGFFCLFVKWHPNWLVMMVPFFVMVLMMSQRKKLFMLLDIIFMISYILVTAYGWLFNYDNHMMNGGILSHLFGLHAEEGKSIVNFMNAHFKTIPVSIYISVFSACVVCIIVVTVLDCMKCRVGEKADDKEPWEKGLTWFRLAPLAGFFLFSLWTCL